MKKILLASRMDEDIQTTERMDEDIQTTGCKGDKEIYEQNMETEVITKKKHMEKVANTRRRPLIGNTPQFVQNFTKNKKLKNSRP